MPKPPIELFVGDVVQTRKGHPCGGDTWEITRLGAEIGMRCQTCGRRVLLPRAEFERRIKRFVQRGGDGAGSSGQGAGEQGGRGAGERDL